jgi:hypothetical protein
MGLSSVTKSGVWAVGVSVLLGLGGCTKAAPAMPGNNLNGGVGAPVNNAPVGTGGTTASTPGSSGVMTNGAAGKGMTTGTGGSTAAVMGTGGTTAGTGGMTAGGTGGMTAGGTGGTDAMAGGVKLEKCTTPHAGEPVPTPIPMCSSFVSPASGVEVQMGPYGAATERNIGKGFEIPVDPNDTAAGCQLFASTFGEDPNQTNDLLDLKDTDLTLYTVYRPALWKMGEKYPLITWGNGTCAQPEGYGTLLRYIASYGFIVVAANSRYVGGNSAMIKALDFMFAANGDSKSPYYQRIDTDHVGAAGHSQGGQATASAASDSRIKVIMIFNAGDTAVKPYLATSGDMDITGYTGPQMKADVQGQSQPGAFIYYHMVSGMGPLRGHLTLMMQPERVVEPTVAWFKYMLLGDTASRDYFVGTSCKLCGMDASFEYGQKGLM